MTADLSKRAKSRSKGKDAAGWRPRIAVAGINHESNSFSRNPTVLADFVIPDRSWDQDQFARWALSETTTVSGFVAAARDLNLEVVPGLLATATPRGPVTASAFEALAGELVAGLAALKSSIDGVYLSLHGAMVVDGFESGDAELVRRVRAAVGDDCPIVVTHDFHANITPQIIAACEALLTYKENPHVDTKARGEQAALIMAGIVRGTLHPVQALVKPPLLYNIAYQQTMRPPLLPIVDETRRLERNPKILAASVAGGYQFADVPHMGPSVVVVTDGDQALADQEAERLGALLWATREQISQLPPDAATAVASAMVSPCAPVVLMDMGDNIGGGSAGDGTFLLAELIRQGACGWVVVLADPSGAALAARLGVGQIFEGLVGAKTDELHGPPIAVRGTIVSLNRGQFVEPEVRHLGTRHHDMGLTAVIEVAGSTAASSNLLVLTTQRTPPYSLGQLTSVGILPQRQAIIVVKGVVAPRAAYEPIAAAIVEVDTAGSTSVNPRRFTYRNVRRALHGMG